MSLPLKERLKYKDSGHDCSCSECGEESNFPGPPDICCSGRDCGCYGKCQATHQCEKCEWKANFDKDKFDLVVDGVDTKDYPDFCDAYVGPDSTYDGEELEDWQAEWIQEKYPEMINEAAHEKYI